MYWKAIVTAFLQILHILLMILFLKHFYQDALNQRQEIQYNQNLNNPLITASHSTCRYAYSLNQWVKPGICFLGSSEHGFQFGTQDLACVKGKRKRSPSRAEDRIAHRYIKYRGVYYEFMPSGTKYGSSPYRPRCRAGTESYAAGYGVLSTECVKGCARYYERRPYHFYTRNCHHFANWLADILCNKSSCPSFCSWNIQTLK